MRKAPTLPMIEEMAHRPKLILAATRDLATVTLAAQEAEYPLITALDRTDLLYHQIEGDLQAFHYARAHPTAETGVPPLAIFRYRPSAGEDLGALAARLGIGQGTLATLNRAATPTEFATLREVLVTNLPGLFIPDGNRTQFERDLAGARASRRERMLRIVVTRGGTRLAGTFYVGDEFTPQELAGFYRGFFRGPVASGRISSRFGSRMSPFGEGTSLHAGIDIVAALGAPVMAAQAGTVTEVGRSGRYGNYVVITHGGSYQTMYAHLQTVSVALRDTVESGTIIGTLGDTGLTTGAHLHFEIRWKGAPVDPLLQLPPEWRRR